MNTDCGHSVRNLKLTRNRAQALRVYPKRLCRGAVRRARGDSRRLLRPLDLLHPGPAAGAFQPAGRRRPRRCSRASGTTFRSGARTATCSRTSPEMKERLARVRGGRDRRPARRLHAGRRGLEIPRHHRLGDIRIRSTGRRTSIVLNRGRRDGVAEEMAAAGRPTARWRAMSSTARSATAVAMSVLNTSFRASGKLAGADYFGSIYWDGGDQHTVVLDELSKYADPQPGQEVVTTGLLAVFPRRRADRLGRERPAERDPHGVTGCACGWRPRCRA